MSRRHALLFFIFLGFLARILLSLASYGSNDVTNWHSFALAIEEHGLFHVSAQGDLYNNNPPLVSYLVVLLERFSVYSGISFPFLLRLPGIFAEMFMVFLMIRLLDGLGKNGLLTACVYVWNPASILISAYHGHTDLLSIAFVFAAAYAYKARKTVFSGFLLALSINIKLMPLILLPAFLVFTFKDKTLKKWSGGLLIGFIPLLAPFFLGGQQYMSHVIFYNSVPEYWGIPMFLMLLGLDYPSYAGLFSQILSSYLVCARFLIFLMNFLISYLRAGTDVLSLFELIAFSWAVFLIFTPGFGVQYFASLMPFLFIVSIRWGVAIAAASGALLLSVYYHFLVNTWPLQSVHNSSWPKFSVLLGAITWILIVGFLIDTIFLKRKSLTAA